MANPVSAAQWVDHIIEQLFKHDNERLGREVERLNLKNSELKGQTFFGFMHMGQRFIDPRYFHQTKALARVPMPTLSMHLQGEVKNFDLDRKKVDLDANRIRQALTPLLINCDGTMQGVRDAIPDCIVHMIPLVAHLKRQFPDNLMHIRSDKYAMKAYQQALPLIEAYSVSALLY